MKKNRLRVILSFIGILVLIWGILCVFSIGTCIGIKNPKQVNTKDSSALRAGNIVSVEYDYIFDHGLSVGFAFGRNTYYELLKIKGREEFVFCSFLLGRSVLIELQVFKELFTMQ